MSSNLMLSVKEATVQYTERPVFENLSFNIHENSRIALVGKNGAGKSTLMNIITGTQQLDAGERWQENGVTIGYLKQDITPQEGETVAEYVLKGLEVEERELYEYKVDIVTEALELDKTAQMTVLSGGQLRRAGLARALVEEPSILLLDEPTNHLDLGAIEWLEEYLNGYNGTLLCVSHDKAFLSNITNKVFWLDRGTLKVSPKGFKFFDEWSTELLEQEERELKNRKQIVKQEVEWASRGVKARRKRNVRRVEQVRAMREKLKADEAAYRRATASINIKAPPTVENSSKVIAEFYNVHKKFEDKTILNGFSYKIQRGDRIGILGKNGSGKTTFLKMLLGELEPDQGRVKRKKELEFSYFDQKRRDLKPKDTLRKTLCPGGGDYVDVMGKQRHVCGYLKDFMFDPGRSEEMVSMLSGGQKNRLMLAKVLAHPKTCLILDEPTNDLDMETLDMLEEILSLYNGTLIVVSHDRDFLDQTVTRILAFEGDGQIDQVIGGYTDYLEKKQLEGGGAPKKQEKQVQEKPKVEPEKKVEQDKSAPAPKKLTFKLEHELKELPGKMAKLEKQVQELTDKLSDSEFYNKDPEAFHKASQELGDKKSRLERAEERWLELEEMKNAS